MSETAPMHTHSFSKYVGTLRPGTASAMDEFQCLCGATYRELRAARLARDAKIDKAGIQ